MKIALLALVAFAASSQFAHAVDASGKATISCGAFTGDPANSPAWVSSIPYSISGSQLRLKNNAVKRESNHWKGKVDGSNNVVLTGEGSGGGGAWVMRFTGHWGGTGNTHLTGGYRNVRGMKGHRSCSIEL